MQSLEERMEVGFVTGEGLWLVKAREDGGEEGGNGECVVRASLALSHYILQQPFKGGVTITPILQMQNLGLIVENHSPTVGKWNPGQGACKEWRTIPPAS